MDGRGGCCIARYAGGGGTAAYDMSKVDQIMLRFRPIAPKPATGGSVSMLESNSKVSSRSRRGKRRYSKENNNDSTITNNRRYNRKKRVSRHEEKREGCGADAVVTLPLLPETPDRKDWPARGSPMEQKQQAQSSPKWLSFDGSTSSGGSLMSRQLASGRVLRSTDLTVVMPQTVRVMGSCVTVECVTDTWVNGDGLGCTDEEKRMNLERDTCPGFISDVLGRVTWTNGAYRSMVAVQVDGGEDHQREENMMVWLVMRERLMVTYPAFTCKVRLQYRCGKERSGLTLPCDVWRMDGGGFAWKLDVKAALCLGR